MIGQFSQSVKVCSDTCTYEYVDSLFITKAMKVPILLASRKQNVLKVPVFITNYQLTEVAMAVSPALP